LKIWNALKIISKTTTPKNNNTQNWRPALPTRFVREPTTVRRFKNPSIYSLSPFSERKAPHKPERAQRFLEKVLLCLTSPDQFREKQILGYDACCCGAIFGTVRHKKRLC
jgi:hypothetical protein